MSRMYILLITMPLLLAFRVSNFGRRSSHSRPRISLQATTARAQLDSGDYGTPVDRDFSFGKLPTPLNSDSQKTALKLVAVARKIQRSALLHSGEDLTNATGLTQAKLDKIIAKSEQIEQKLLELNLRLVHSIALQHQGMGLELDDLVYEGVKGLKKALSKFDAEKGFAFSTYAYPWIREYIRSALASSLPIALPMHVYRLLVKVRTVQQRLSSYGISPSDEEMAEEMGISMERFDVVRRAMALAAHCNDNTPALSESARLLIRFDEATWERVVEPHTQGSVLEHLVSDQAQPQAHTERTQSEMRRAVLSALNTLPQGESRAIHERLGLGTGRASGMLKFSEMQTLGELDSETAKHLYQKGVRRLRRRATDPKYPEMKVLQSLFNELQQSDEIQGDVYI